MRDEYLDECKKIEQNCTYTAETHHIIAERSKKTSNRYQIVPAIIAAALAALVGITDFPKWIIWFSVISAVVAAVGSILNPLKDYYDHLNAAKNFTVLKQDANSLHKTFNKRLSDDELVSSVEMLHARY